MIRNAVALGMIVVAASCGRPTREAAAPVVHSCKYAVAERGTSGQATVEILDGAIVRVDVTVAYAGLPDRPGYSCTLEASGGDPTTRWSRNGAVTEIAFAADPHGPEDLVVITQGEREFVIDLSNTWSSGRCGAGAELPARLTIPRAGGTCGVTL